MCYTKGMKQFYFELSRAHNDNFIISLPHERNTCDAHIHKQMEILYVVKGCNRVTINNDTVLLAENQMAIADSFDVHSWQHVSDVSIMVQFPYTALKPYITHKAGRTLSSKFILEPAVGLQFKAIIDLMQLYARDPSIIDGLVRAFVALITKHIPLVKSPAAQHQTLLNDILMYIEENFDKDLSLESVAQQFSYSKYHFSKLFNQMLGIHFENYVNMVRTQNVIYLIKEKNVTLINAIFESGFSSVSTFYRTFKKQYNCGVKSYLKEYVNLSPQFFLEKRFNPNV